MSLGKPAPFDTHSTAFRATQDANSVSLVVTSTVEILLLGDRFVTQQQLFEVKATAYSSRSTITQVSVDSPPLKGMSWKSLTVERAKTSMGRW